MGRAFPAGRALPAAAALFTTAEVAWLLHRFVTAPPAAGDPLSVALGSAGLLCMVVMLIYSVARRSRRLRRMARLSSFLAFHIFMGVQGWLLTFFHCWGFLFPQEPRDVNWLNPGVLALLLVNVVFFSGIFGRYLFARLPRTLAGQHMDRRSFETEIATLDKGIPAGLAALWADGRGWGGAARALAAMGDLPAPDRDRAARRIALGRRQAALEAHQRTFSAWIVLHRPLAAGMFILAGVHTAVWFMEGFSVAPLLVGIALLAAALLWSAVAGVAQRRAEARAREAYAATVARGAQPASLHPAIDLDRCVGTGACAAACPEKDVLAVIDGKARVVNPTNCIGHGECRAACPVDAIRLVIGTESRGVEIPLIGGDFQTAVPGLYIVGELGGMGLIYNAVTQGVQCVRGLAEGSPPPAAGTGGAHQLCVVGAGPAGLGAALAGLEAGLDVVTLDQEDAGGTILQYPRRKVVMTRPFDLPVYGPVMVHDVSKEALLDVWKDVIGRTGLKVRAGVKVRSVARGADGVFDLDTTGGPLRAHRVVLAIGRRGTPRRLGVSGEDGPNVAYRLLAPEDYAGTRCVVAGGGDAAVEAALALAEAGATLPVPLVCRADSFGGIRPKNQDRLDAAIAAGLVAARMSSNIKAIRPDGVAIDVAGTVEERGNDYVFVFAGGELPTAFLKAAGVTVQTFRGEEFAPANA